MKFHIIIQPIALKMLQAIADVEIRRRIIERIDGLADEPEKLGKPLLNDLAGYRSLRAAGQRYRIVYNVQRSKMVVSVVALGIRKDGDKNDIYRLAKKLVRLGLAE